ncbi:MAG: 4Fe-4S binding protein [Methylotenera sp.]|nr:4Fe-4S binding protein [Oligoflexia bacterium]
MTSSVLSTLAEYFRDVFRGARSLFGSFMTALPYLLNVNSGDLRKEVTEQYPDPVSSKTADDLPPRTRGLLFNDIDRCSACRECEWVCPVHCIEVETQSVPADAKVWVSKFDIDFAKCIFCGLCVEVCQPASLIHTKQFEGSVYDVRDLKKSFGRGPIGEDQRRKWARAQALDEGREDPKRGEWPS